MGSVRIRIRTRQCPSVRPLGTFCAASNGALLVPVQCSVRTGSAAAAAAAVFTALLCYTFEAVCIFID